MRIQRYPHFKQPDSRNKELQYTIDNTAPQRSITNKRMNIKNKRILFRYSTN